MITLRSLKNICSNTICCAYTVWVSSRRSFWVGKLHTKRAVANCSLHSVVTATFYVMGKENKRIAACMENCWARGRYVCWCIRPTRFPCRVQVSLLRLYCKPIWTYGTQLWGTASTSIIEILERFQSKALRMIVDAPWYVLNTVIRRDLHTPTVKEEIRRYSSQYSARLSAHPNDLTVNLMELPDSRRLWRHLPNDLPTRFLVKLLYL
jgi:hypothetical protein